MVHPLCLVGAVAPLLRSSSDITTPESTGHPASASQV